MRSALTLSLVIGIAAVLAVWLSVESRAQAPETSSLAGLWIRNAALSDPPPERSAGDGRGGREMGRGRGMGRGGFGGGFGRGGGRSDADREEMARVREAIREVMQPPDQLTITQTDSMVAITGPDGRTTRLSPDGSRIKDENTKIERTSHWDAGRLISEIRLSARGGPSKVTQTYSVDPAQHQLRIVVHTEGGRDNQTRAIAHVYDADAR